MTNKLRCTLSTTSTSYEIEIHHGLLKKPEVLIESIASLGSSFALVTDETVAPLYGELLYQTLSNAGLKAFLFSFPSGELSKTRATKEHLEDQLFAKGFSRDTCVIALGGGVTTDLGGYLAATFCRGVPLVMIPTSLLAMVDASIGGKTGVNTPYGKNLIGCIYQPKQVLIDPSTLHSLPIKELRNGVVEMIKHGLVMDRNFFEYLETHEKQLLALNPIALEKAIFDSCLIKKEIVEQDEKEGGKRRLLNFGHTVGHALERLNNYSLPHGEAVAIGLLVESHLALQLGHLDSSTFKRIQSIILRYGLPLQLPSRFSVQALLEAMVLDKKSLKGRPRFVIIDSIGSALSYASEYCTYVEENMITNALQWMNHDLCCH